ncbi:uncharacterized protein LOC127839921 [Dreissena polymorpha]|uniref:Uncharacterized protein n=1 Tax=Dreissena polymorpha TaxID=45954 RepID=A0A9D4FRU0_DREPO|nr:uncharacterized protein LOC127839921 [Dreissena polymorpha]KAH3801315.1 hypothetical protein DPMN_154963 [Dreissena polymorpha]
MALPVLPKKIRRTVIFLVALLIAIYALHETSSYFSESSFNNSSNKVTNPRFLVDTPLCKIPYIDPFDITLKYLVRKTDKWICPVEKGLTYQTGKEISINWTIARSMNVIGGVKYCTFTPLYRPNYTPTHNNYLRFLAESAPFHSSVTVNEEFVKTTCYDGNEKNIYNNFHAFIQRNASMDSVYKERFLKHVIRDKITEKLNIMMIGMDSVSRLSFIRQMVETKKFLDETMGAFDMSGYNKVADNTFINIVPMTMGKFVSEMPWDESKSAVPFDDFKFIWNNFSESGYRTFYAEDAPEISIFDFLKAGFKTPPSDHFNRPMSIAMELKQDLWTNNHHCFQDRLETDIVLQYLLDFVETYQHEPHFAFTFITRLSHDDVNSAGAADEPYYKFFKILHERDLIRNTVIFFYSDHGMRFGKIRETYIGKLEERLPFMYVVVPKWLTESYPFIKSNLQINQHRLTTPFDVYETLLDILQFNGKKPNSESETRGISWFREVPIQRSCDGAGILPHWCTCLHHEKLQTTDEVVLKASVVLLSEILKEIEPYFDICETLTLYKVIEATRLVESDEVLRFLATKTSTTDQRHIFGSKTKTLEDIQVVIETVPGNALFEATVRFSTMYNSFKVVGDVSRINIYGHQSDCIEVFKLKKYCQCKDSIK